MKLGDLLRPTALVSLFVTVTASHAAAQGTMVRPRPESETTDSSGFLKAHPVDAMAHGSVSLADGSPPPQLVEIYGGCGGAQRFVGVADSRGRVNVNLAALGVAGAAQQCSWRAVLDGYRSETEPVIDINPKSGAKLGSVVLQPLASDASVVFSAADAQAANAQKKMLRNAIDEAAKQHWSSGIEILQKLTAANPGFCSAWLTFGILQQNQGDAAGAERSFVQAVHCDPRFALPLIRAATLEAARGDWKATLDHSAAAIALNPVAFPGAYALNAIANVSLQNAEAAEHSAREGIRLDPDHQFPELEYSLGVVLYTKEDAAGAAQHLQAYVKQAPFGPNAASARVQLGQLAAPKAQGSALAPKLTIAATAESAQPLVYGLQTFPLQARNAALLEKTPLHTCLETIARAHTDAHGQFRPAEIKRVEIAIADGKEIYAEAGGKKFSNQGLTDMVGYTFSTTGLFGSIARALMAGNGVAIQAAGEEVFGGVPALRYNFQSLPGTKGWTVQDGKDQGSAAEQGWFLVDRESLILRRVSVEATAMPRGMKLKALRAVIDYDLVTIAGRQVLLPSTAQVSVGLSSGAERESKILFDHCRVFGSESTLSFSGDGSDAPDGHVAPKPAIPADLEVTVALSSPISLRSASASDLVTATVVSAVSTSGHQLIPRGALVQGHVRVRRADNSVILELDQVQTAFGWAPFYAHLSTVYSATQVSIAGRDVQRGSELSDPEVPGVARLVFASKSAELPVGTKMIWNTESLAEPQETRPPQLNTSIGLR